MCDLLGNGYVGYGDCCGYVYEVECVWGEGVELVGIVGFDGGDFDWNSCESLVLVV